jgi:hypothetical protein
MGGGTRMAGKVREERVVGLQGFLFASGGLRAAGP